MLDFIICSHSTFSKGLLSAAEMICGPIDKSVALCLEETGSLESLSGEVRAAYDRFTAEGDEVLCLVDVAHATPYNACFLALADTDAAIIAGMSLPMLLDLATSRSDYSDLKTFLREIVLHAQDATAVSYPKEEMNG